MKFLVMSGAGDGLGLAYRLRAEGNEVGVWIKDPHAKDDFDGLLRKYDTMQNALKSLTSDTIIVFDSTGGGRTADRLRGEGYSVFGGSVFADQLERDRGTAFEFMREVGIRVPPSKGFTSFARARKYVQDRDQRLVFKPSGDMGPEVTTYVSYDQEDMLEMLEFFESRTRGEVDFELQDMVEDGLLVSSELWIDGERVIPNLTNHTFERKPLMNGDIGPSGGCAGNVVFFPKPGPNRILEEGILRMEPILAAQQYVGPIDLNTIVNDDGVWALEFTPRFGYDALPAFLELLDQPVGELISQFAKGEKGIQPKVKRGWGGALRVTIPPYPNEKVRSAEGLPIRGLERSDRPHLYMYNVALDDRNKLVSTKAFGVVGAFTGFGDDIAGALKIPYELADRVRVPNKQYRTDLCEIFCEDHEKFLAIVPQEEVALEPIAEARVP